LRTQRSGNPYSCTDVDFCCSFGLKFVFFWFILQLAVSMASRVAALARELKNIKSELRNLAPFIEMVKSCQILLLFM
jgi:hypothetical protein